MLVSNLRHLRVFLGVADYGSVTQAAAAGFVSQPAVTQAIAKLEAEAGTPLFQRTQQGLFPTQAGAVFRDRVWRALNRLDFGPGGYRAASGDNGDTRAADGADCHG